MSKFKTGLLAFLLFSITVAIGARELDMSGVDSANKNLNNWMAVENAMGRLEDGNIVTTGTLDVNGVADALILDADGDTTISAPTDDQIDIELAGADDFTFTANLFDVLSGSQLDVNGTIDISGTFEIGGTAMTATATELNNAADISTNMVTLTSTTTLTTSQCGQVLLLSAATEFATTLPAATLGCKYKVIVTAAPSSADYTLVTDSSSNVIIGGVNELEVDDTEDGPFAGSANPADTVTFVDGVSVISDWVEMISDGTNWYLNGQTKADGGVTLTST